MLRIITILSVSLVLIFASCNGRGGRERNPDTQNVSFLDSLRLEEGMGRTVERVYEGVIPAADGPGIEYTLRLYQQQYTNNGVYELQQAHLEADGNHTRTFTTYGRWETMQSSSYDILHLRPFDSSEKMAFYAIGDDTLQMLDTDMNPIESEHNYLLRTSREFRVVDRD